MRILFAFIAVILTAAAPPPQIFYDEDGKNVYIFTSVDEGRYVFTQITINTPQPLDFDIISRSVYTTLPKPDPPPDPSPDPPKPEKKVAWATMVYDVQKPDTQRALIRTDPELRAFLAEAQIHWRTYEDDSPSLQKLNILPLLNRAGGPPALVLQDAKGIVIDVLPCPPTTAGVISLIKNYK